MNFNTILTRFGVDPDNFVNAENEPTITSTGFIYEVEQRTDIRICPYCSSENCYVNNYFYTETSCRQNEHISDILRIRKVRFKCRNCGKTFTPQVKGIERRKHISSQVEEMIYAEFFKPVSFSSIAKRYGITRNRVIQIFDEKVRFVPRRELPKILCIDEKRFSEEESQNYCCLLYDFKKREIVDIVRNRQLPYMEEYFDSISKKERENVKFFVSDMYDGYETLRRKYFPGAVHIIDLFHIVKLLTQCVNSVRTSAMKKADKDTDIYRFMKKFWRLFLERTEDIPDKYYRTSSNKKIKLSSMVLQCAKTDDDLLSIYNILQDFYHYYQKRNYKEASEFVDFVASRLDSVGLDITASVAKSFRKWKPGIATSISKSQNYEHYSNSVAENANTHIENIIRVSYGYHNFERFRKRVLLIRTYNTKK